MLLIATVLLFPFLFLTLELPKRIINDAIGAGGDSVFVFGFTLIGHPIKMIDCLLIGFNWVQLSVTHFYNNDTVIY